jgi:hypothetical protein
MVYVYRKLLMATLNFSTKKTLYTAQHATEMNTGKPDEQGKDKSYTKTADHIICDVSFTPKKKKKLPTVLSHHTRSNSDRTTYHRSTFEPEYFIQRL